MKNERIAKRVYLGECADRYREEKRFGCKASKEKGALEGCMAGDEPLIRCHSYTKPWKGGIPSMVKPTT